MNKKISPCLEENISALQKLFGEDKSLKFRRFQPAAVAGFRCAIFFTDGMVDSMRINESIIEPVVTLTVPQPETCAALDYLQQQVLQVNEIQKENRMEQLLRALLYGDTILFLDGSEQALILGSKGFEKRSISEPASETYLKGPREGFVEPMLHNLAMLRRKLRTTDLKLEYFTLGENTRTDCCLCYLDNVVDRAALSELRKRISHIVIDGVLDSNYISELVREWRYSPFRTTGSTERPDVAAAKLLEGRIVIFVDGSPTVLTVPHIFLEQFQSGEDYYVDATFAGINRILRIVGFFFTVSVVPVYLALVAFHQAFMPLPLILTIAKARQGVPFPIFIEALLLLLAFDLLREAGARTPSSIGQSLSVVGGLVIGQAAVEARLVSVPVLIVVAVSGICSLTTPKVKAATFTMRIVLTLLGVRFGIYGYLLGMIAFIIFLAEHSSFGVPYLSALPLDRIVPAEDSMIRVPYQSMRKFGRFLARRHENGGVRK